MCAPFLARRQAWRCLTPGLFCLIAPLWGAAQAQPAALSQVAAAAEPQADHSALPEVGDLATLTEMAWARSPHTRQIQGQQQQAQAQADASKHWFAGAPSVTLGQRTGDRPGQRTLREQEIALQAPLWSSARRTAAQGASEAALSAAQADLPAWRLELAHQVRERIAALTLATLKVRHAQSYALSMRQLEDDVTRRVKAGDMATADALLMRQDVLRADTEARQAQLALIEAGYAFRALVGEVRPALSLTDSAPADLSDTPLSDTQLSDLRARVHDIVQQHPRVRSAQAAAAHLTRQHELQLASAAAPWELGLQHRRDQDAQASRTTTSWGVNIKIPLADDPLQHQSAVAARVAADVAAAQADRVQDLLERDLLQAIQSVEHLQMVHVHTQAMAEAARQRAELIRKAYALGEMGLPERLKAEQALTSAALRVTEQRVLLAQARARLQYAQGAQP